MYLSGNDVQKSTLDNGVVRSIMAHNDELMIVRFEFKKGQVGALHSHPHTQSTYILSGKFEFEVSGKKHLCVAGDTLIAKSAVEHGCVCLEDGVLIDNFTPHRADFLQ
jgi:quercetin dioxygenase-like cupin family protein